MIPEEECVDTAPKKAMVLEPEARKMEATVEATEAVPDAAPRKMVIESEERKEAAPARAQLI